jgi:large subunit ribosomal protein L25
MVTQQIPRIEGQLRENLGTRQTARVRSGGGLPAVIYGHKQQPLHIRFDHKEVTDLLHQHAHLIEVVVGSKTEPCLVKDIQWNHLGSSILHIDLARVDLTERITVEVDLKLVGDPVGLKEAGSFLQRPMDQIEVECLASQIPEFVKVDISELGVEQSITVADLSLPEGVAAKADGETLVASIHIVKEEAEEPTAEAATAQPELIGKKPAEEEAAKK